MAYFLDLFTPETWDSFQQNTESSITGFRERQRRMAEERVSKGDIFLCYLTRLSRWCGVLRVESEAYYDDSPILDDPDPFKVRFRVEPIVILEPEYSIPIHEDEIWSNLSSTKHHEKGYRYWTGPFRNSLKIIEDSDGDHLMELLQRQQADPKIYPLSENDRRQLAGKRKVRIQDVEVEVEIPEEDEDEISTELTTPAPAIEQSARESVQMQAKVAEIGIEMGFDVWVPRNDRARVLEHISSSKYQKFSDKLPFNYNDQTIRTVEQIDVLWIDGMAMARAFEIEDTTAVYSGLLRMADLLALQPNMDIRLHIVAPDIRREKVLREIKRPAFSRLGKGRLSDQCSFLSYDSISALANTPHLSYMKDAVIAEYEEFAEV